ncbi:hypothetical protein [Vallitalea guaymasensis]|uniref:hypothetical protein n=1 Tax=Vallitalea guaymasensis TaxID=1185412 RepID=UPI0023524BAB|nr:hypothetical protein [Vallitalea guaymasensis]
MSKVRVEFRVPDSLKNPTKADAFRLGFNENNLLLDFGTQEEGDNEEDIYVSIHNRLSLPIKSVKDIIGMLIDLCQTYKEEYNIDLKVFDDSNLE